MVTKRIKACPVLLFLLLALANPLLLAQDSRFRGTVKDDEGKPIPKAQITLTLIDRNYSVQFETDAKGKFYRRGIEPGDYLLKVEVPGFQPFQQQIYIQVGQEYKMDIVMPKTATEQQVKNLEAKKLFEEGVQLYQQEKHEEAIAAFAEVIALVPDFAEGYYNLGMAYLRKGDSDAAVAQMKKAVELKPDFLEAHLNLGMVYFTRSEDELALDALLKARDLDPSLPQTYCQLGLVYTRRGELDKTVENFEKFIELAPQAPEAETVKKLLEEIRQKKDARGFFSPPL
jgi:tetratricopeptide (TPR) repeat protein